MDVTYITEMSPNHDTQHDESIRRRVTYVYDLEVDANKKIIGGEWYSNRHPDFLWSFNNNVRPAPFIRISDNNALEWNPGDGVPQSWRSAAKAAARLGTPLNAIIDRILFLSQ